MCIFTDIRHLESPYITPFDFCYWGWKKSEVYKIKVDTRYELLSVILGATACIKKRDDQLRRTARDLHTRVVKCSETDGGILERLLGIVTDL